MGENVKIYTHEQVNAVIRTKKKLDNGQEIEEEKVRVEGVE